MSDPKPEYGYDNPAPGTRLWRLRNHPQTMSLEDAIRCATELDRQLAEALKHPPRPCFNTQPHRSHVYFVTTEVRHICEGI